MILMHQPLPIVMLLFAVSLILTMGASAWFTRRLEAVCDALNLPPSLLSLLGALGANIPNYVASIVAIADGQLGVGLGIIIGSNIYNVAIILSIATFATPKRHGILLTFKEARDARVVAAFSLSVMVSMLLAVWLLPGSPLVDRLSMPPLTMALHFIAIMLTLGLFGALAFHALLRQHPQKTDPGTIIDYKPGDTSIEMAKPVARWIGEGLLALVIALGGVVVMVQSGQALTTDLHMPDVLAGLLVLAVATSLPNTVVAFGLARTDREVACVEEIFSSNSINAALGIALPILFWRDVLQDHILLFLDGPLMAALTLTALFCVFRRRVSRVTAVLLLLVYVGWVVAHVLV
jgi:cation:H+ antiporter